MADENLGYAPSLDEIVFEHRNKAYGAYDLRKSYRGILTKSFILGTILFILAVIAPFVAMKIKEMAAKDEQIVDVNMMDIKAEEPEKKDEPILEEAPPPPPPKPEEQKVEVIQNVVPEPVKAPKVETPPPPITEQLKTQTGVVAQEGIKQTTYAPPPPPPAPASVEKAVEVIQPEKIYESVDQEAEYPGGMNALRRFLGENFDTSIMDGGEGTLKAKLRFVVETDGRVSDVQVIESSGNKDFDKEAVRDVSKLKKWTPGKKQGQSVRSRYTVPFVMNFE